MTLLANLQARRDYTRRLSPQLEGMTAAQASEALFGWVYKQPGMATLQDCKDAAYRVGVRFGMEEAICLYQRFGVSTIKDLWIGQYEGFVAFANATLEHGVPPSASWTGLVPTYQKEEEL